MNRLFIIAAVAVFAFVAACSSPEKQAAQADADQQVAEAVARIHAERDAARESLEATARALASDIAGRVLGRSVAVG